MSQALYEQYLKEFNNDFGSYTKEETETTFRNYLEEEDDHDYYHMNSLSFYYEELEKKRHAIEEMTALVEGYNKTLADRLITFQTNLDEYLNQNKLLVDEQLTTYFNESKLAIDQELSGHIGAGEAAHALATAQANGFMSAADFTKLGNVQQNANNYTHPATHPPSIIEQDTSNRFTTDAEKAAWTGKASTAVVTTTVNGLMIAADKVKLNGIATSANNYVHPATHPPSVIVQDVTNRFTTDAEKVAWNAKETTTGSQTKVNLLETKLADLGFAATAKMLSSPDLNVPLSSGLYYAVSATNRPAAANGYLEVLQYSPTFSKQDYTLITNGATYTRIMTGGTWLPWKLITTV